MIELNMKAKPFHPCESALGVELLLSLTKAQLVGSVYYKGMDATQDIPKDILVWCPNGVRNIRPRLKAEGWVEGVQHLADSLIMNGFVGYVKNEHKMFITPVNEYYTKFIGAQEICKMWYERIGDITKEQLGRIHDITMFSAVDGDGQLQMPHLEEEDGPDVAGAAPQFLHEWAHVQPAVAPQGAMPAGPHPHFIHAGAAVGNPWGGAQAVLHPDQQAAMAQMNAAAMNNLNNPVGIGGVNDDWLFNLNLGG